MPRTDLLLTATAPAVWGSTYLVTTELLPGLHPLAIALLRALPAGLLLLVLVRRLPQGIWWARVLLLGVLNFSLFWFLLFVSAYRLPGGVAATVGAVQPLIVLFLGRLFLGSAVHPMAIVAGAAGVAGIALLTVSPEAALDPIGIAAGLGGAVSMAFGTVLTRRWQPPVSLLTFTAWQLTAGGLVLLPVAAWADPGMLDLTATNLIGLAWLGLVGAAATYVLWFRGIARLGPAAGAPLGLLSPVAAVILGWAVLGQALGPWQLLGMAVVVGSVWFGQRVAARG
jgi:probable blue pigment (indigoidine) exporter